MKNVTKTQNTEYYGNIPSKNKWSYILLLFPQLFYIPIIRKVLIKYALPNCKKVSFEPGFRFFYGKNIVANSVEFGNTLIMDYAKVTIGRNTVFSRDNKVITATHDYQDRNKIVAHPVTIGDNVWISTDCLILGGVEIGDNTVIGAGSVVTKDIPANCFAAGNPCVVKKEFDKTVKIPFNLDYLS